MENSIITDLKSVEEFFNRGPVDIIGKDELKQKMMSGKQLRAYIGYDVTGPNLHLGHTSTMLKLKDWQNLGHKVVLVIGDYTARIGDHSDKLEKRKRLDDKEIEENRDKFIEQFNKIIDISKAEIRYNSEWLSKLRFNDIIDLTRLFTVQQMIDRENFAIRLKNQSPIGLEELMYPIMQGFDAYTLRVDLQIGGVDQIFNMLAGRKIMENFDIEPQSIITMPLINGTDGRKMSKSWNNYIAMLAEPKDIFGKIMSCTDDIIIEYFKLLTRKPLDEISKIEEDINIIHSLKLIDIKKDLAFEITKMFYGEEEAINAREEFQSVFQNRGVPKDIREINLNKNSTLSDLLRILVKDGLIESNSSAKRLLNQKGIRIDDVISTNLDEIIKNGSIIRFGKNNFVKVHNS